MRLKFKKQGSQACPEAKMPYMEDVKRMFDGVTVLLQYIAGTYPVLPFN